MTNYMWRFYHGYVKIVIKGGGLDKLLEKLLQGGAKLSRVRRTSHTVIELQVPESQAESILILAAKEGCSAQTDGWHGLPCLLREVGSRPGFWLGLAAAVVAVFVLAGFVLTVDIEGARDAEQRSEILSVIEEAGFRPVVWRRKVDQRELERLVMANVDGLAFVGSEVFGAGMTVRVVQATEQLPTVDRSIPCDIVAEREGLITSLCVYCGTPVAKVGDYVYPGDILVSGLVEIAEGKYRAVHSLAQINAREYFTAAGRSALSETVRVKTGEKASILEVQAFGKKLSLPWWSRLPDEYELHEKELLSWGGLRLRKKTFLGVSVRTAEYPFDAALSQAERRATEEIKRKCSQAGNIKTEYMITDDNILVVTASAWKESALGQEQTWDE